MRLKSESIDSGDQSAATCSWLVDDGRMTKSAYNRRLVCATLFHSGPESRVGLHHRTGLPLSGLTEICGELLRDGRDPRERDRVAGRARAGDGRRRSWRSTCEGWAWPASNTIAIASPRRSPTCRGPCGGSAAGKGRSARTGTASCGGSKGRSATPRTPPPGWASGSWRQGPRTPAPWTSPRVAPSGQSTSPAGGTCRSSMACDGPPGSPRSSSAATAGRPWARWPSGRGGARSTRSSSRSWMASAAVSSSKGGCWPAATAPRARSATRGSPRAAPSAAAAGPDASRPTSPPRDLPHSGAIAPPRRHGVAPRPAGPRGDDFSLMLRAARAEDRAPGRSWTRPGGRWPAASGTSSACSTQSGSSSAAASWRPAT